MKSGNFYYNVAVLFGASRAMGVAYLQQNTSGAPASLNAAGQYAVDANKVYVYVPDGTNPNTYYGEMRIFGADFSIFSAYTGTAQNVRIFGINFEQCVPFTCWSTTSGATGDAVEIAYCRFSKTLSSLFKHSNTGTASEASLSFHDNLIEDSHSATVTLQTAGTAGNVYSWELYRNRLIRGNVASCYGGALVYNQCSGGTKHIAWGNYIFDARNGYAGEQIDGAGIYTDVKADKAIVFGNIFEQCGKGLQANSQGGMTTVVANLAIDCGSLGSVTNTTGDLKSPSAIVAHNTYLWTGRIQFSALSTGPNIGGTGVKDWGYEPAIEVTNSQANTTSNTAYNFGSLSIVNNALINLSGAQLANKKAFRYPDTWTTTMLAAGNAACGFAAQAAVGIPSNTDFTSAAKYFHLLGGAGDAKSWMDQGASGVARPGVGSPLVGAGASLSVQYQDIGGRNFAATPTIGCYEVNA